MFPLLIALVAFALAGTAATYWLRQRPAPGSDLSQGLTYLAGLHWGEFTRLVLRAMHARGYSTIGEDGKPTDGMASDGKDILLKRGDVRTLLSCKYGNASVVSASSILGLGKSAKLRGADGAIVATPGRFEPEAQRVAAQQQVELVDGEFLWKEVKPFVPEQLLPRTEINPGESRAPMLAWGGAAVLAGLVWLLAHNLMAPIEPATDAPTTPVTAPASPGPKARVDTTAAKPTPALVVEDVPTDPEALQRRRQEAANSISTVFGVTRALWSSQSTLEIHLSSEDADPMSQLCPILERYPELAASRLQLQPPAGSERPVRFRQCRAY